MIDVFGELQTQEEKPRGLPRGYTVLHYDNIFLLTIKRSL
jgi:hypothetical protein